jgi:hypothetical protein
LLEAAGLVEGERPSAVAPETYVKLYKSFIRAESKP